MSDIILICLPPYKLQTPNPALSVLKSFLTRNNVNTHIEYLNIKLSGIYSKYIHTNCKSEALLSPFLLSDYFTIEEDVALRNKVLIYEARRNKQLSFTQFNESINHLVYELIEGVRNTIQAFDINQLKIVGISFKYNQWIPGIVIAKIIKALFPEIKVVLGGIDNKNSAKLLLRKFDCFDYAIYGDGEYPLLELHNCLFFGTTHLDKVPQLIYKEGSKIQVNRGSDKRCFNEYFFPDYSEYFNQIKYSRFNLQMVQLPINAVRGCNWNRCKFCISKKGTQYQERHPDSIIQEIKEAILKYGIYNFIFTDNCSFREINKLHYLADELINVNNSFSGFLKIGLTINNSNLSNELVSKLFLAGVDRIQTGFESFSDNLLSLMQKNNTLCDNILFIKLFSNYKINLPLLLITGLPEENISDVSQCIENLHYFRFFLSNKYLHLSLSPLGIHNGSQFYSELTTEKLNSFSYDLLADLLPTMIREMDAESLLLICRKSSINSVYWDMFLSEMEEYKSCSFNYKFVKNNNEMHYLEYQNDMIIKSLVFDNPLYCIVLEITELKIHSLSSLEKAVSGKYDSIEMSMLKKVLSDLKSAYLVYYDFDFSQIISTVFINTERQC